VAEPEESLITDAHRAFIGRESDPIFVTVREEDVRRMRAVLGDTDPRYAEGTGIAPPYIMAMMDQVRRAWGPGILPGRLLTQTEWTFTRPFRIGEELKAVAQVTDIRDRLGGRYGYSVLVSVRTDFYDAEGKHVAAVTALGTQFDPKSLRSQSEG
jgi:hypothetical protein